MDGPYYLEVHTSKDGFATGWSYPNPGAHFPQITTPFVLNCPNNYVEDLSGLGELAAGQTLSVRFYASMANYTFIPAGLWNKSSDNYNLTVNFTPVPEPSTYLAGLGALGIMGMLSRRHRLGGRVPQLLY